MCAGGGGTSAASASSVAPGATAITAESQRVPAGERKGGGGGGGVRLRVCVCVYAGRGALACVYEQEQCNNARLTRLRRQDGGQHGYGTIDPDRQQAAGCLHAARRAYAARSAADRGGGRPECGQEFRARELRRQRLFAQRFWHCDKETAHLTVD